MVRMYDGRLLLELELRNSQYACERDVFELILDKYDREQEAYEVENVIWVLQDAEDWKYNRGEYYDDEGNPDEREMSVKLWRR